MAVRKMLSCRERRASHVSRCSRASFVLPSIWTVIGTTNLDNRSFEHNDEINVAMHDPAVAARLLQDYERDLADSTEMTLERWRRRPVWEKIVGPFVWILERQQ